MRVNLLQGGEVDMKKVKQGNFVNHIKALVQIGPMVIIA